MSEKKSRSFDTRPGQFSTFINWTKNGAEDTRRCHFDVKGPRVLFLSHRERIPRQQKPKTNSALIPCRKQGSETDRRAAVLGGDEEQMEARSVFIKCYCMCSKISIDRNP